MADQGSQSTHGAESGNVAVANALRVRRNATVGFGLGTIFALGIFVRFAYLADRRYGLAYWVGLAIVLAVGVGLLLTILFTAGRAYRLARRL